MYGLFILLPVLAIHANQLDASAMLMGIAMGVYGITQAIFQIPFGLLSDRIGRKPVIVTGLLVFAVGSLVAAFATSIWVVILGRALQGAGAIAAAVLALTSDLTRDEQRTKAMAIIGMSIGSAFLLALITAPLLQTVIGVNGLFFMTAGLALLAVLIVLKVIPTPVRVQNLDVMPKPKTMQALLNHRPLLRLNIGIFTLHFVLTALFVVIPILLLEKFRLPTAQHWKVYVPALLVSIVFMVPLIVLSARKQYLSRIFLVAILLLMLAQIVFLTLPGSTGVVGIAIALWLFFWGFNLLEALLPSLVSRVAPVASKGSAMGVYNTFQFFGIFLGGFLGGLCYGKFGVSAVFLLCGVLLLSWFLIMLTAPPFTLHESMTVTLPGRDDDVMLGRLKAIDGVKDVVMVSGSTTAYLKVNKKMLDSGALNSLLGRKSDSEYEPS